MGNFIRKDLIKKERKNGSKLKRQKFFNTYGFYTRRDKIHA